MTARIEKGIENINQINLITPRPFESRSEITIRFEEISQCDFDRRIQNLRTVDDRIRDLPEQIPDEPEVASVEVGSRSYPMITMVVTGDLSGEQLKSAAEKIEERILATFQIEGKEIEFREVLFGGGEVDSTQTGFYSSYTISIYNYVKSRRSWGYKSGLSKLIYSMRFVTCGSSCQTTCHFN